MLRTLPNLLTISRILLIPVLVAMFFFTGAWANWVAFAVFVVAASTDYLDGHFARARGQHSSLGAFLDPVADKLLVATTILMLAAFDRITGLTTVAGVIILCREILVSGMREFLAGLNVGLPVTHLAKWKTAIQMIALAVLLVGDSGPAGLPVAEIGAAGLWAAAVLTVVTGYGYVKQGLWHMLGGAPNDAHDTNDTPDAASVEAGAAHRPPLTGGPDRT